MRRPCGTRPCHGLCSRKVRRHEDRAWRQCDRHPPRTAWPPHGDPSPRGGRRLESPAFQHVHPLVALRGCPDQRACRLGDLRHERPGCIEDNTLPAPAPPLQSNASRRPSRLTRRRPRAATRPWPAVSRTSGPRTPVRCTHTTKPPSPSSQRGPPRTARARISDTAAPAASPARELQPAPYTSCSYPCPSIRQPSCRPARARLRPILPRPQPAQHRHFPPSPISIPPTRRTQFLGLALGILPIVRYGAVCGPVCEGQEREDRGGSVSCISSLVSRNP